MMNADELKNIIEKHKKWLMGREGGEHANLRYADLRGADLRYANLTRAILAGADLSHAHLRYAYLFHADLSGANLSDADLFRASLCGADLSDANLSGADLFEADLHDAILLGADIPMTCPDSGAFTAWKKAHGHIVKLLIPEDARRSSATGRKCRCDKAVVVAIETISGKPADLDVIASDYDETFIYKVGETVTVPNFCGDRFKVCAAGIHFFVDRQEAVDYI